MARCGTVAFSLLENKARARDSRTVEKYGRGCGMQKFMSVTCVANDHEGRQHSESKWAYVRRRMLEERRGVRVLRCEGKCDVNVRTLTMLPA